MSATAMNNEMHNVLPDQFDDAEEDGPILQPPPPPPPTAAFQSIGLNQAQPTSGPDSIQAALNYKRTPRWLHDQFVASVASGVVTEPPPTVVGASTVTLAGFSNPPSGTSISAPSTRFGGGDVAATSIATAPGHQHRLTGNHDQRFQTMPATLPPSTSNEHHSFPIHRTLGASVSAAAPAAVSDGRGTGGVLATSVAQQYPNGIQHNPTTPSRTTMHHQILSSGSFPYHTAIPTVVVHHHHVPAPGGGTMTLPPTIRIVSSQAAAVASTPMPTSQLQHPPVTIQPSQVMLPAAANAAPSDTEQQQHQWHPPYNHNYHPALGFRKDFEAKQRAASAQKAHDHPMTTSSPAQTNATTSPDMSVGSGASAVTTGAASRRDSPTHPLTILPRPRPGAAAAAPSESTEPIGDYKVVTVQGYKLEVPVLDEKTFDDGQPFPTVEPDTECQFGMQDEELNDVDVLCGRGGMTNAHPGNVHFRHLVNYYRVHYGSVKKCYKSNITKTIVTIIRKRHGRFLRKSEKDGLWYEVGDVVARDKTAQTLREGLARMVRTSLIRAHKQRQNSGDVSTPPTGTGVSAKLSEQAQVRMVVEEARKRWEAREEREKTKAEEATPKRAPATAFTSLVASPTKKARTTAKPFAEA